jgi:hypothetical protein
MMMIMAFPLNLDILVLLITFLVDEALEMDHDGFPNGPPINLLLVTIKQTVSGGRLEQLDGGHGFRYK